VGQRERWRWRCSPSSGSPGWGSALPRIGLRFAISVPPCVVRGDQERLAQELDLTPEQRTRVDSIMAQQMADFRHLQSTMRPRFDSVLATGQARLDSVLTPAQREKLRTLRSREVFGPRESRGARERRPPPPGPPPSNVP